MVRNGSQQEEAELLFEAAEHGEGQNHKALARVPHQEVGPGTRFPWARGARAELERQLKFEFTREWAAPSGRGGERKKGDL